MSNSTRLVVYLAAFIIFCVATLLELVETKKITWQALVSAGFALITFVPLWDAIEKN